ncbi:phosphotransferase family protein [Pseudonocardia kunmingensis]|uniref:Aminoglycoside phosphotransferase (APT) family kinase protein n=1 Tax=Pseudonocardia kunmingensis TaxID=630975 RepID=A0A543DRJ2_9PSEU|nr:phosphotransferase family protein [Pseudonocardia kunmingensis]TQM11932.1 aminoglycoside phosphotransferase (APT) family kinase protein [Pseudonocardia kunmingensis]
MTTSVAGLDLPALRAWFAAHVPGAGELDAELIAGGRSNLTYRLTDGRATWVLRRPPLGGLTPSAHDMAREYRVVAALRDSGVPVAGAVALCEDPDVIGAPFAVVEHVSGRVVRTRAELDALTDAEVRRCAFALVDVLARLHAVDPAAVGLAGFGRPEGYLVRQVRRWHDQWTRVATRPLSDVDALHARLAAACPPESGASIVHGDFRIDNAILDGGDAGVVRALVDWEMATLGDPLADLGLHLAYADPAFDPVLGGSAASTSPRLPAADEVVARYAAASGRDVSGIAFHLALGYFKAAVIAEGIHARHVAGRTVGEGFDTVGAAVAPLAAAGLAAARAVDSATGSSDPAC